MLKKLILLLILLLTNGAVWADENAGAFQEMGIGARAAGMGMSYVSHANGSDAVYWNPAALAKSNKLSLTNMSTKAFETDYHSIMAAGQLLGLNCGAGYIGAQVPGIKNTALDPLTNRYVETGKTLTYTAAAYYGAIGVEIQPGLALGLTTKLIREEAAGYRANGIGADLGLHAAPAENIAIGLNVQNMIKPRMKWNTPSGNTEIIPTTIKAGMGIKLINDTLTLTYEADYKKHRAITQHCGLEYRPLAILPLRAGLDNTAMSFGIGLEMQGLQLDLSWTAPRVDYLDDIYRFSVGIVL